MNAFWLASVFVFSAVNASVRPLEGEPAEGKIVSLTEKTITLETVDGPKEYSAAALHQVRVAEVEPAAIPQQGNWVELADGSRFVAGTFELNQGRVTVDQDTPRAATIPARIVHSVRFFKPEDATNPQWNEMKTAARTGDVLVVRKMAAAEEKTTSKIVLDQLEGIVHQITNKSVAFEYDGERIDVPRARLEGVLFGVPVQPELPDAACRITEVTGAVWNARSVRTENEYVRLTSVAGAEITFPLPDLAEVDFSSANLVFLSDLEPEVAEWRPYFQSPATPASLQKWFQPRRDQGANGQPLTLSGTSFDKGLALHSHTLLSYRLTKNFGRLVATVGIDNRAGSTGNLVLQVVGDDRTLLTQPVKADAEPFELDVDVRNVRRLKIIVDFGEDRSDAGDWLYLANARLVK